MTDNEWAVIVDWNPAPIADQLLSEWLEESGLDRAQIDAELRCDLTRSVSGVMEFRYSIRPHWITTEGKLGAAAVSRSQASRVDERQ